MKMSAMSILSDIAPVNWRQAIRQVKDSHAGDDQAAHS
jgi:hypothetical protein